MDEENGFSAEVIAAMVQAGVAPEKIAMIQQQIEQAEAIKNQAGPEGRGYGGVYSAANPMEFAGDVAKKYMANKRLGDMGEMGADGQQAPGTGLYGQQQAAVEQQRMARQKAIAEIMQGRRTPGYAGPGMTGPGGSV